MVVLLIALLLLENRSSGKLPAIFVMSIRVRGSGRENRWRTEPGEGEMAQG